MYRVGRINCPLFLKSSHFKTIQLYSTKNIFSLSTSLFEQRARSTYQLLWHFIPHLDQTCLELWQGHMFRVVNFDLNVSLGEVIKWVEIWRRGWPISMGSHIPAKTIFFCERNIFWENARKKIEKNLVTLSRISFCKKRDGHPPCKIDSQNTKQQ
jgi:hypothetical protein